MSSLKLHLIRITQLYRMLIYANLEKQKLSTSRIYSESIKQVKLSWADGDRERGRETRLPTPPASLPTNTTSRCESFACKRKSSRGGNNTLLVNTNKCQAQNRWSKKKNLVLSAALCKNISPSIFISFSVQCLCRQEARLRFLLSASETSRQKFSQCLHEASRQLISKHRRQQHECNTSEIKC